ncbi:MAG TPA: hypothetical protein DIW38_13005 [Oceanicaulis sp.]|nr:hypothetical protein [Oceanicaulis sp.]
METQKFCEVATPPHALKNLATELEGSTPSDIRTLGFDYNPAGQITERTDTGGSFAFAGHTDQTSIYDHNALNQIIDITETGAVTRTLTAGRESRCLDAPLRRHAGCAVNPSGVSPSHERDPRAFQTNDTLAAPAEALARPARPDGAGAFGFAGFVCRLGVGKHAFTLADRVSASGVHVARPTTGGRGDAGGHARLGAGLCAELLGGSSGA